MPQSLGEFLEKRPGIGAISSRTRSVREAQTDFFRNKLFTDDRAGQEKANRLMNWIDNTGTNLLAYADDLATGIERGDPASLGIAAASALVPAIGRSPQANRWQDFFRNESGMFMGPKAKNADLSALSMAQYLKESGASREEILSKTGWFQGKDSKWRFEIPSDKAMVRHGKYDAGRLGDIYTHEGLYENYPELEKMLVKRTNDPRYAGAYDPANKSIAYSMGQSSHHPRDAMTHEVQHAIQDIEGFDPGAGNAPEISLMQGTTANQIFQGYLNEYVKTRGKMPSKPEIESLMRHSAQEGYERSAGEAEALNTQRRAAGLGYKARPWETQHIPYEEQLTEIPVEKQGILDTLLGKLGVSSKGTFGKKMMALTPDQVKQFRDLGEMQRGGPEEAMLRVQRTMGGGVLSPVVEHAGDLIHRMSHHAEYGTAYPDIIADKTRKVLRFLKSEYGFEKEMGENIINNAKYRGVDPAQLTAELDERLASFGDLHSKMPAYNEPQRLARDANVAIGKKDWKTAILNLEKLQKLTEDPEKFNKLALSVGD